METPLVTLIVFGCLYGLFELFVRRRERLAIIDKLCDKLGNNDLGGKLDMSRLGGLRPTYTGLKVSCLLIGIGLGFIIGFLLCLSFIPDYLDNTYYCNGNNLSGIIYGACLFIFGGIGLLTASLIGMRLSKKE